MLPCVATAGELRRWCCSALAARAFRHRACSEVRDGGEIEVAEEGGREGKGGQQQPQTGRGKGPGRTLNESTVPCHRAGGLGQLGGRRAPMDGSAVSWRKRGGLRAGRTPNPARALFSFLFSSWKARELASKLLPACGRFLDHLVLRDATPAANVQSCTRAMSCKRLQAFRSARRFNKESPLIGFVPL